MLTRVCRFDFNVHYPEMAVLMFILKELKEGLGYGRKSHETISEEMIFSYDRDFNKNCFVMMIAISQAISPSHWQL